MTKTELKTRMEQRNRALTMFNQWEVRQTAQHQSSDQIFASLGAIYALLPAETRCQIRDPEYMGIRTMHDVLRHLSYPRR